MAVTKSYSFPSKITEGENYFVQFDIFKLDAPIPQQSHAAIAAELQDMVSYGGDGKVGIKDSAKENLLKGKIPEGLKASLKNLNLSWDYKSQAADIQSIIKLPLQIAPSESTAGKYNDVAMRDTQTVLNILSGQTPDITEAMALVQDETLGKVGETLNRLQRKVLNQQQSTFYEGPDKRSYSFSFNLIPRNWQDSQKIENIVKRFHYHAAPGVEGVRSIFFTYPEMVRFFFTDRDNNRIDMFSHMAQAAGSKSNIYESKACFIDKVDVEYGMLGDNLRFRNPDTGEIGKGTAKLSIALKEAEYFTKKDYDIYPVAYNPAADPHEYVPGGRSN